MIDLRLCIVGLGLMGGSLAQALHGEAREVVGVDAHAATRQQALADGVVDRATADLTSGISTADMVILATPVKAILRTLAQLPQVKPEGCLVLDLGSTKQAINVAMSALPDSFAALGGHPMCGKEQAGYSAADPDLYRGQTFILTRNERSTAVVEREVLALLAVIGAQPLFLSAEHHDQLVASVSHVPYLLSAALARQVAAQEDDDLWRVSASGYRDTSRLAGSDPQMMLDILLTNRTAVSVKLAAYQAQLGHLAGLLDEGDDAALAAWLAEAQQGHATYRQAKQSPAQDKSQPRD